MKRGYFVTGTDTDVGKTLVSAALVHGYASKGCRAVGMKPIASGANIVDGTLVNEDVVQLRAAANIDAPLDKITPYVFASPIAPHIAAMEAGVKLKVETIVDAFSGLRASADIVVVEGAGGFLVPLDDAHDMGDIAAALGLPVILVVGMRLGCINHALLTVAAIESRGLVLAGWIANVVSDGMSRFEENMDCLRKRIDAPCLGVIPHLESPDFRQAAEFLHLPAA